MYYAWGKVYIDDGTWSYDLKAAFLHQVQADEEFGAYYKQQGFDGRVHLSYRFPGLVDYHYKTDHQQAYNTSPIPEIEKEYDGIAFYVASNADAWLREQES
jgi:hypothetical protein